MKAHKLVFSTFHLTFFKFSKALDSKIEFFNFVGNLSGSSLLICLDPMQFQSKGVILKRTLKGLNSVETNCLRS